MPAVCRVNDSLATGHICTGTTTIASSNTDGTVHANGRDIIVVGAPTVSHAFPPAPPCAPHVANLNAGSPTVFINGIAVGRIGDSADAGAMTSGSSNVFADGGLNPTFTTIPEVDVDGNPTGQETFSVIQPDGSVSYSVTY